ncbi:cytochrome P450 [Gigaspora rosea]|uniref:Cytochrome P450 n=1 Tax=Gigaspora rosea TaxID=44941 RepID=A0A397VJU4_9GLOM|nr:cytochrome P450 [Gigaspora rosea]
MNYYLVAIISLVGYVLYKIYIYPLYLSPLRKIPGPPANNFIIGHYASFLKKDPIKAHSNLIKKYGGLVRYHVLFNQPYLLISDPKLVQQVMSTRAYEFPRVFLNETVVKEIVGESILFAMADSHKHKRQRKIMNPSFAFANVKEMIPTFVQAGHKLKDIWTIQIGNKKEKIITVSSLIPKITLDVIGLVGFNHEFNSTTSESELAQAYNNITNNYMSPLFRALEAFFPFIKKFPTSYNAKYYDSIEVINKISQGIVSEQKNTSVIGKDLLSLLVKENERLPVDEQLTNNELVSQVMTLLVAGHDTTSSSLSWALYFLAKNPDCQDRLRKEILDVFTDRDHCPTFDEIDQLKYLECVFKETLRTSSPVSLLMRQNSKEEIMNGYVIPKGTPLVIPIHAIHHDPLIWGDDADDFNPSRWLNPEIKSKISHHNFFPFGAGPANCLGMKMAHLELKSILSVLIRNFEFKLVEGFTFKKLYAGVVKPYPGMDLWVSKMDY